MMTNPLSVTEAIEEPSNVGLMRDTFERLPAGELVYVARVLMGSIFGALDGAARHEFLRIFMQTVAADADLFDAVLKPKGES